MLTDGAVKEPQDFKPGATGLGPRATGWAASVHLGDDRLGISRSAMKSGDEKKAAQERGPEAASLTRFAACRRHLVAPAGGGLAVPRGAGFLAAAFCRVPLPRQAKIFGKRAAHLRKNQPADAGGDQKGSDRIVARLFCQQRKEVVTQSTSVHAQQVADDGCRRNVKAKIRNPIRQALARALGFAFQLCR